MCAGHCCGSSTPSPAASPAAGSPRVLRRSPAAFSAALRPSASRLQLNPQAKESFSTSHSHLQPRANLPKAASDSGDIGSDSDSSDTSNAASFYRSSASAAIPETRHRRSDCSLDFSSSWRASDTVPFPQVAPSLFAHLPVPCRNSMLAGTVASCFVTS